MGPNLFSCDENQEYVMPSVTAHAVMSYGACMQASQSPLCRHGMPENTYGHADHAS